MNYGSPGSSVLGISRDYWSQSSFPALGDLPDPGTEPASPTLAGGFFTDEPPGESVLSNTAVKNTQDNEKVTDRIRHK